MIEYIQVKHTRKDDSITYSDMIEGGSKKSYLYKYSSEWKIMERKNQGKNKVVFFTNRKMGKRKHTLEDEWERPPLTLFWKTIKDQVKSLGESSDKEADISKVVVKKEWKTAWDTWKDCMSDLDAKEQLLFLQNFELVSDQEDLNGIIFSIADELQKKFKTTHEKAVNLHQKLCYQLMWWATSNGNKKEIDKEDRF